VGLKTSCFIFVFTDILDNITIYIFHLNINLQDKLKNKKVQKNISKFFFPEMINASTISRHLPLRRLRQEDVPKKDWLP